MKEHSDKSVQSDTHKKKRFESGEHEGKLFEQYLNANYRGQANDLQPFRGLSRIQMSGDIKM